MTARETGMSVCVFCGAKTGTDRIVGGRGREAAKDAVIARPPRHHLGTREALRWHPERVADGETEQRPVRAVELPSVGGVGGLFWRKDALRQTHWRKDALRQFARVRATRRLHVEHPRRWFSCRSGPRVNARGRRRGVRVDLAEGACHDPKLENVRGNGLRASGR